jgi:hypothetical protein
MRLMKFIPSNSYIRGILPDDGRSESGVIDEKHFSRGNVAK